MEYQTDTHSMVYISTHNSEGSYVFSPKIGSFEIEDVYPCASNISRQGDSIRVDIPKDQLFARILILKKQ